MDRIRKRLSNDRSYEPHHAERLDGQCHFHFSVWLPSLVVDVSLQRYICFMLLSDRREDDIVLLMRLKCHCLKIGFEEEGGRGTS